MSANQLAASIDYGKLPYARYFSYQCDFYFKLFNEQAVRLSDGMIIDFEENDRVMVLRITTDDFAHLATRLDLDTVRNSVVSFGKCNH